MLRLGVFLCVTAFLVSCVAANKGNITGTDPSDQLKLPISPIGYNALPRKPTPTRIVELTHTVLDLEVDWSRKVISGKAELTLRPYFYPTDSVLIDAKNLQIDTIVVSSGSLNIPFVSMYDGNRLRLKFDKKFHSGDTLQVEIEYSAYTDGPYLMDSVPTKDEKGLYWINHDKSISYLPRQLWTQGETSYNSRWFPTIDHPNERCTQEVYLTVDSGYSTLSNGLLVYSMDLEKGKRKDYWKQTKPHAPYLCMIAVGEFDVFKDTFPDLEVSYYVEPEYAPYAKRIFGHTPQMIHYFSQLLNCPFPWEKYAQVIVRQFVSGAMENTSASVFMDDLLMDDRELIDTDWDFIIAHELFHQWFGNLVTCESWTHLTLNEALANYSEYLWAEHNWGKDFEVLNAINQLDLYLSESRSKMVPIIRYRYNHESGLFDNHTYAKGGMVMRLLRQKLGDEAFFKSLNHYLTTHAYSSVEIHDLRQSFEHISGLDLEDFFQQWFLSPGHPQLKINYKVTDTAGLALYVHQAQTASGIKIFDLEIPVFIRQEGRVYQHTLTVNQEFQGFNFKEYTNPDWIIVDPDKYNPAEVIQEFSIEQLISMYFKFSESTGARFESIKRLKQFEPSASVYQALVNALEQDVLPEIRQNAIEGLLAGYKHKSYSSVKQVLKETALEDKSSQVRADALEALSAIDKEIAISTARLLINDSSYTVLSEALSILLNNAAEAPLIAERFSNIRNGRVVSVLADYFAQSGLEGKLEWYKTMSLSTSDSYAQFALLNQVGRYCMNQSDSSLIDECIEFLSEWGAQPHEPFTKLAVFQSLQLFRGRPEAETAIEALNKSITDPSIKTFLRLYE